MQLVQFRLLTRTLDYRQSLQMQRRQMQRIPMTDCMKEKTLWYFTSLEQRQPEVKQCPQIINGFSAFSAQVLPGIPTTIWGSLQLCCFLLFHQQDSKEFHLHHCRFLMFMKACEIARKKSEHFMRPAIDHCAKKAESSFLLLFCAHSLRANMAMVYFEFLVQVS